MLATNEKDALKFKIAALQRSNEVLLEESRKVQFGFEGGGSEIDPSSLAPAALDLPNLLTSLGSSRSEAVDAKTYQISSLKVFSRTDNTITYEFGNESGGGCDILRFTFGFNPSNPTLITSLNFLEESISSSAPPSTSTSPTLPTLPQQSIDLIIKLKKYNKYLNELHDLKQRITIPEGLNLVYSWEVDGPDLRVEGEEEEEVERAFREVCKEVEWTEAFEVFRIAMMGGG
ncbi:hypothetical protein TrLO_g3507 [Triparma laevis f. longispina]|uniref:Uncharacterized protein n=1 Tax=Triparma laevis f. longispina TaxID=1714387 RepID=A0A9W7F7G2_9STRA|nr:hypothetical protein TrLO_g3507 [Triparma laevis f. longispina]